jgi:hypothetical protein
MIRMYRASLFSVFILLARPQAVAQTVAFTDDVFTGSYTITRVGPSGSPAQARLLALNTGANQNSYGLITIQMTIPSSYGGYPGYSAPPGPESAAWFFFSRPGWQIAPPTDTSVTTRIDYTEQLRPEPSFSNPQADTQSSFPAIRQGGTVFVARRLNWSNNPTWQTQSLSDLNWNDFVEFLRPTGARLNLAANAPPLEIGFVRGFTASATTEIQAGIDGFSFRIRRLASLPAAEDTYVFSQQSSSPFTIAPRDGVVANDGILDPAGGGIRAVLIRAPQGSLTLRPDGSFDYTPRVVASSIPGAGIEQTDWFEYRLESTNAQSAPTRVTLRLVRPEHVTCSIGEVYGDNPLVRTRFLTDLVIEVKLNGTTLSGLIPLTAAYRSIETGMVFRTTLLHVNLSDRPLIPPGDGVGLTQISIALLGRTNVCSREYLSPRGVGLGALASSCFILNLLDVLAPRGEAASTLSSFRRYRDSVLAAAPKTAYLRDLYYRHSPEMIEIFRGHPELLAKALPLLRELSIKLPHIPLELERSLSDILKEVRPEMSAPLQRDFDAALMMLQQPEIREALGFAVIDTELVSRSIQDASGNTYAVGAIAGQAFLRKTSATHQVVFERRFGGSQFDIALGLALGPGDTVHVVGLTQSEDFPVVGTVPQRRYGGAGEHPWLQGDSFWVELSTVNGAVRRASFWGGEEFDVARAVAVDGAGMVYIAGHTGSARLPLVAGSGAARRGKTDAFVAKFDPSTGMAIYSIYLGGDGDDAVSEMAALPNGELLLIGTSIIRLDASATRMIFNRMLPAYPETIATSLAMLPNEEFAVAGYERHADGPRAWLARYNLAGQMLQRVAAWPNEPLLPLSLVVRGGHLELLGAVGTESSTWEPFVARYTTALTTTTAPTHPSAPTPGFAVGYDSRGQLAGFDANFAVPFLPPSPESTVLRLERASTRRRTEELTPGALFVLAGLERISALRIAGVSSAADSAEPPTELGGLRLRFEDGSYARLHAVQPAEVVFVAPEASAARTIAVEYNGEVIASRRIRWADAVPQLFTADGQPGGRLLGEWVRVEDQGGELVDRISFFASGLPGDISKTRLQLEASPDQVFRLGLELRTPVAGYVGLEQILTAPVDTLMTGLRTKALRLRLIEGTRTSNVALAP